MKKILAIACLCFLPLTTLAVRLMAEDLEKKYEAARKKAEADLQRTEKEVAKQKEERIKEVEARLAQVRQWTKRQFEVGERNIINKPKAMASLLKHWQTQRENELYQLLQFPEHNSGGIESGRALNALMESVGPAALQNCETRKVKPEAALPLCDANSNCKVDDALAEKISWQENVAGAKLVGQGSRGPLDLDWPAILRDEQWKEHRQRVDAAIQNALAEINTSPGLSSKADAELREAIGALNDEFIKYRREWIGGERPQSGNRSLEYQRICEGQRHIKKLVLGAYQLVELSRDQMSQREPFQGGTIEEYIAYFQRHNLRFATASPASRSAYHQVFEMMVRYYLDQKMAVNMEENLEKELAELKHPDQAALNAAMKRLLRGAARGIPQQERDDIDAKLTGQSRVRLVNRTGQPVLAKLALGPSHRTLALANGQSGSIANVAPGTYAFLVRLGSEGNYSVKWTSEFQVPPHSIYIGTISPGGADGGQDLRDGSLEEFNAAP